MNHIVEPRGITLRAVMQYEAASRIQSMIRNVRSRRLFLHMLKFKRRDDMNYLIELLKRGMKILKTRSDGNGVKKRFLFLEMGQTLETSRLYTCANGMMADKSKWVYLADIADVRLGARSYLFNHFQESLDHKKCLSIICGASTFDFEIVGEPQARNWFAGMLLMMLDQALSPSDITGRGRIPGGNLLKKNNQTPGIGLQQAAEEMGTKLEKGIDVLEYTDSDGSKTRRTLWISRTRRRIYLGSPDQHSTSTTRGIDFDDIAEVRKGIVSSMIDKDPQKLEQV